MSETQAENPHTHLVAAPEQTERPEDWTTAARPPFDATETENEAYISYDKFVGSPDAVETIRAERARTWTALFRHHLQAHSDQSQQLRQDPATPSLFALNRIIPASMEDAHQYATLNLTRLAQIMRQQTGSSREVTPLTIAGLFPQSVGISGIWRCIHMARQYVPEVLSQVRPNEPDDQRSGFLEHVTIDGHRHAIVTAETLAAYFADYAPIPMLAVNYATLLAAIYEHLPPGEEPWPPLEDPFNFALSPALFVRATEQLLNDRGAWYLTQATRSLALSYAIFLDRQLERNAQDAARI